MNEFLDKDQNPRSNIRTCWWELEGIAYRDLAMLPSEVIEQIPHEAIPKHVLPGYDCDKPLFVGQYWLTGVDAGPTNAWVEGRVRPCGDSQHLPGLSKNLTP